MDFLFYNPLPILLYMQIELVYQDPHLAIIHKPAGIDAQLITEQHNNWHLTHRLDKRVSGLMIVAKTKAALSLINELLSNGKIEKKYTAIVANKPTEDAATLTHWLVKNSIQKKSIAFKKEVAHSKKAMLTYQLLQSSEKYHLLAISLLTGRFHQIRAQLAAIGSPIVGDIKYGYKRSSTDGSIFLHATSLKFTHPITKEAINIQLPLPAIWQKFGFENASII